MIGYRGWFYHFLDMTSAVRANPGPSGTELSSIDSVLLLAGILYCKQYFDGTNADETSIRSAADAIFNRVDWTWMAQGSAAVAMGWFPESLQTVFGWIFAPVAWLIGVPWRDAPTIGNLLGTRMAINEFVAFSQLGPLRGTLDPRSFMIATFALCGFANFSSIGIQIGGIGALAPGQRDQLAKFGIRAMLAGTMANLMSACIVGLLS